MANPVHMRRLLFPLVAAVAVVVELAWLALLGWAVTGGGLALG